MYYTDASTYMNGRPGQDSRIVVHDGTKIVLEKHIGNYTINEAELIAITEAMKLGAKKIRSDSKIAIAWAVKGWTDRLMGLLWENKTTERHRYLIRNAHNLLRQNGVRLFYVHRSKNLAGIYIEEKQNRNQPKRAIYGFMSNGIYFTGGR